MKQFALCLLFLVHSLITRAQTAGDNSTASLAQGGFDPSAAPAVFREPVDLGSTRVSTVTSFIDGAGKTQYATNSYTEIANGLNFATTNGLLLPSVPEFSLVQGAALAWKTGTKISLGATLDSAAPVQIRLPSGELMSSRLQGLSVTTPDGQSVLVADIKEGVQGVLVASNIVVYPDCFSGETIQGDLRYTVRLDGIEQDVVIRSANLSSPDTLTSLGLTGADPNSLVIEGLTEFLSAPDPVVNPVLRQDTLNGQPVTVADSDLQFGSSMRMAAGRSFMVGQENQTLGFVSKQWVTTPDQRRFLIEQIPLSLVESQLPAAQPGKPGAMKKSPGKFFKTRLEALNALPKGGKESREAKSVLPLKAAGKGLLAWLALPGVTVDYSTISGGLTNATWLGTTTYLISAATTLYGTNTIWEAGSVLKYASNASVTVTTPVTWQGSSYRPIVLCSKDDNSTGEPITGSTGTPTNYLYASTALILDASTNGAVNTSFNLAHLRIANAQTAIQIIQGTNGHTIKHAQFVNCGTGINASGNTLSLHNALMVNVLTNFAGSSSTGDIEHLTSDGGNVFQTGFSALGVTNSLLTGIGSVSLGTATNQVAVLASNSGVFQNLSLGSSHYLAGNSPYRGIGTTGINPVLAGELIDMSTTAPYELGTNYSVSSNLALAPKVPRNTGIPDVGFHFDSLDYVVKGITLSGTNTLSLINGVAVGFYGTSGITPGTSGKFSSFGLPENLNRLTLVNTVFEQPQSWISSTLGFTLINGTGQNLRFTDVAYLAAPTAGRQISPVILSGTLNVQDCQLRGVYWQSYNYSGSGSFGGTINLRNSLLERCTIDWTQGYAGTPYYLYFALQNNLFTRSSVTLTHCSYYYGSWAAYDCLFDNSSGSLTEYGGGSNVPWTNFGCNGYIGTTRFLSGTGDVTGLSRDFVSGPLGEYYYPTNSTANSLSTLIGADTVRTPATSGIGLSQYTTTLDQIKDSGTNLDIGMHYVALESHRASVEFSSTQGSNNWYYERTTAPLGNSLLFLTSFSTLGSGPTWWDSSLTGNDTYTWVWATGQHPGVNYDSARVWQSAATAKLSVWSTATDSSPCPPTSDGVKVQLSHNTVALSPWVVLPNSASSPVNARTFVQADDLLQFQVNKNANNACDATTWDPLIVIHRGISSLVPGLPDWFSDSNGDNLINSSDGTGDFDGDGIPDRADSRPFDAANSATQVVIERPADGSTVN